MKYLSFSSSIFFTSSGQKYLISEALPAANWVVPRPFGKVKRDGTIKNKSVSTVGYVKKDGTVENSSHSTLGYIKNNGTVENSSHGTVGYASGIKKEWAAVVFFFFILD